MAKKTGTRKASAKRAVKKAAKKAVKKTSARSAVRAKGCCRYEWRGNAYCETITRRQCDRIPVDYDGAVVISFTEGCTCPGD